MATDGQLKNTADPEFEERPNFENLDSDEFGLSMRELRKALKAGQKYADEEDWEKALPPLMKAWEFMPEDLSLLTIIAHALSRLGVREYAVSVLDKALSIHEPTEDLCTIMLILALDMEMFDVAVKIGLQVTALNPEDPKHYVNLATAYSGANELDDSIDMLQGILPKFPDYPDLWNVLATQVRERDGTNAADVFFEEALRLDPNNYKTIGNYAMSFTRRNQYDKALELTLKSIELEPNTSEPRIGAAHIYFMQGKLAKAWDFYECRHSHGRKLNQTQIYTHEQEIWKGEDIAGKTLFVTAEQGIGDEVMFGNYLPHLYERSEKLIIGCQNRLVSLYKRRFPNAIVDFCADAIVRGYRYRTFPNVQKALRDGSLVIDYAIPVASAPKFEWLSSENVKPHRDGFLKADPVRQAHFATLFEKLGSKPKVGLAWTSGITTGSRLGVYATVDELGPLFALSEQVDFINLQYGDCADDLALIKEQYGVTVHQFDGVDLKQDIEANIALMANCDVVVSSCSAPGMFALSSGRPTILMSSVQPWWCFGDDKKILFAKDAEFVQGGENIGWSEILPQVVEKLEAKLGL